MYRAITTALLFGLLAALTACADRPAAKPGADDIVHNLGGLQNAERFQTFVRNVEDRHEDRIRIIYYTIEGDPIYKELRFDGETIHFMYDTTHDAFGTHRKWKDDCTGIAKTQEANGDTSYTIRGCRKNSKEMDYGLLSLPG